jgi:four helix bundle protein
MRRAALSVTDKIAEGHGRWHSQENIQFCRTARGSVEELIDDFNACIDEGFRDPHLSEELKSDARQLIARINGYNAYLRKCKQGSVDASHLQVQSTTHHSPLTPPND